MREKAKPLFDKERVICIVKSLIMHRNSVLSVKYLKSHEKVMILYKDNVIELNGGEEKFIKYLDFNVPLSKREYKDIYKLFMDEVTKRKEKIMIEKFEKLEHSLNLDNETSSQQIETSEPELNESIQPSLA